MSDMASRLTAALADRYRIERELGQGGMATVYLATDLRHQRHVAIKVVRSEISAGMGSERFLREIRLAARLHHPNILPLYDSGDANGELYYVMPVAEGESLRDRIIREKCLPVSDAVRLAGEVAGALDYAHRHEVVHRDIKPENILLHEGHALITDFGIGKALTTAATGATLTQLGLVVGTPAYMSPEQAGGEPNLDGRTDLYSLGCVLYEMLAGEPPFTGNTVPAVIAKRFKETPPDATVSRPSVPRAVAEVARKLMAMDPAERYPTGAQAVEALTRSITPPSGTAAFERPAERSGSRIPWIAVLPFSSRETDLADLAEGLTEEITTGLSRFPMIQVVSWQSAQRAATGADLREAGKTLGARYLVDGSIRKSGRQIRVNVQLVDGATGASLWAEVFDRDLEKQTPFGLQDDLADRIVVTVADPFGVLVRAMAATLKDRSFDELTASELVIRAWAYSYQLGPEEHARLRDAFERALEREPDHAEAWACLADLYWEEQLHGMNIRPDSLGRARRAAQRAVECDPASQFGWAQVALVQYFSGDVATSRQTAERAIALNPRNGATSAILAMALAFGGQWDRGHQLIRRLMDLNPHHAGWYHFVPFHYHFRKGEFEAALATAKRINMPQLPWTFTTLALAAAELGRWDEVEGALDELRRRFPPVLEIRDSLPASGWFKDQEVIALETRSWRKVLAGPPRTPANQVQSIAVLPFANMSPEANDAYFADGITEEIINALAQVPGLNVAARTSCFAFKGKNEDLRVVGDKLGVQHVLEGSVRKAGSRVRVTAQLIKAADGYHLWSERYDRELVDIFALQDEIANGIATKLSLALHPARQPGESPAKVRNVEAYELLLKGRALLWQRGRAILDALPCLERAGKLDPDLVDAHALLGDAYRLKWLYGMAPARETVPQALAAIHRALGLDPENPQALSALANIKAVHDLDREGCIATSDRALRRDPRFVQAHCERAVWLAILGQATPEILDESLRTVRTARELDPLNSWAAAIEAFVLLSAQRNEEAVDRSRQAIALDPDAFTGRWTLVWSLSAIGADEEALAVAGETLPMSGRNPRILTEVAAIHARRGERDAVREIQAELRQRAESGYIEHSVLGCVSAAAGNLDEARVLVARGIAEHEPYFQFAKSPAWAAFRADPDGRAMLEQVGF
jgi:TolB-like protein/tRNA A-37 threonylcarbamoyl transferase component Bud32/cytochrome c-type biogenesis protein CcmH/NrfG